MCQLKNIFLNILTPNEQWCIIEFDIYLSGKYQKTRACARTKKQELIMKTFCVEICWETQYQRGATASTASEVI